jgi:methylphosphotriester-DNA--protein-cysteine methyltransferase
MSFLLAAVLALLAASLVRAARRERELGAEMAVLAERVREVSARLEATEQDVAQAALQAGIAESVLVEKGLADEEDLEAVRRRFDADGTPGYVRGRDGALN